MDATSRFVLIRVKIERAKKHLLYLETDLIQFGHARTHVVTTDKDPHTSEEIRSGPTEFRVWPFDALAAAGDIVHNLRSALDHLANHLVWVGSAEEPSRRVEFPIAKDAATYEASKVVKVEGMCPKAIKAIDALKPYKGGNDALWKIYELDNIDKHRTLFTYDRDCMLVADWLVEYSEYPFNLKATNPNFVGVYDSNVEKNLEFEIDEAVSKPKVPEGNALLPTLHQLVDYVDNLVRSFIPFLQ